MARSIAGKRICLACQVTVLSVYNSDPLCGGCARVAQEVTGTIPAWVWDSVPLRVALARVDLAVFAQLVRRAAGLSLEGLGFLVGDGWSQSLMSRIEQGARDTLYDIRKLLTFTDALGMPRAALAPLILGDPDATLDSDDIATLCGADMMDVSRRGFTTMAAGLAMAAVLPVPERVDLAHVRYLQSALIRLRDQDDVVGGGGVLPQCLRLYGRARRMLDESDYSAAVGREFLVVTTDLGIKSAWSAYDADNQALARQLYEQSALLADSAGDGAQRAYLYANMVQQSTCLARHTGRTPLAREALRFADRAADAARHEPSPALHALISLRRSLAHAQLGDEAGFRSAITTARRELDRGPHEADTVRTRFVRHSEITGYEAFGRVQLGELPQATRLYQSVLGDTTRSPRDQAYYRALLARNLMAAGDPEQALSHGLMILPDLGAPLTSVRILRELRPVREGAAGPAAAQFRERFDAARHALRAA